MKRNKVMAFIIGAGVAGTILVFPYTGLAFWKNVLPQIKDINIPLFLLPIIWGFWNWLYIRLDQPFSIGAWGVLLGLIVGIAVNILIYAEGQWFPYALIALVFAPAVYGLLWLLIIAPLNSELEV
jgi:hypothetical protein